MPQPLITITADVSAALEEIKTLSSPKIRRAALEGAAEGVAAEAIAHFRERGQEPRKKDGFPANGQDFPKTGFWKKEVEDKMGNARISGDEAVIPIDSPGLRQKADPGEPPIVPKGHPFLAIPANARAAAYPGNPADFAVGRGMEDKAARKAAREAARDFMGSKARKDGKGTRKLQTWKDSRSAGGVWLRPTRDEEGSRRNAGRLAAATACGRAAYWLVKSVRPRHDPRALPDHSRLQEAAYRAAKGAIDSFIGRT